MPAGVYAWNLGQQCSWEKIARQVYIVRRLVCFIRKLFGSDCSTKMCIQGWTMQFYKKGPLEGLSHYCGCTLNFPLKTELWLSVNGSLLIHFALFVSIKPPFMICVRFSSKYNYLKTRQIRPMNVGTEWNKKWWRYINFCIFLTWPDLRAPWKATQQCRSCLDQHSKPSLAPGLKYCFSLAINWVFTNGNLHIVAAFSPVGVQRSE